MKERVEAGDVDDASTSGKHRFRRERKKVLSIVRETANGTERFKIAGLYIGGKRVRRFFSTEAEAKTFVESQEVRAGNIGALAKHLDGRTANDAAECTTMLKPYGVRLLDAVRDWVAAREALKAFPDVPLVDAARHHAALLTDRHRSWTVAKGSAEWLRSLEDKGRSARYRGDANSRLSRFTTLYGSTSMADITRDHVQRWLRGLGKLSPQSQKNYLTVAASMFAYAVKQHRAPRNPVLEVEKPEVVREEAGILTPAELQRLLSHLAADAVPFVVLSAFAGLRPAEVQRLEWQDINFDTGIVSVRASKSKTKRRRTVPMTANLAAWLKPLAKSEGRVVELADITIRQKRLKPAREQAKLTRWPHDCLRHSAATYLLQREGDAARVALWLGHTQEVLHEHYKGLLSHPKDAVKWFKIMPLRTGAKGAKTISIKAA